jgi:hypothetical protein
VTRLTSNRLKARESAQRYHYRRQSAELVRRRWERSGELCDGCGRVAEVVEVAHLFSRAGHIISDAMASDPDLCAALCCARTWGDAIGCHESIDRNLNPTLLLALRMNAIDRYARTHGLTYDLAGDPLGIVRGWERAGVAPQGGPT